MNPNQGHNLQSPLVIFSTDNKHKHEFAVSIDEEAPPSEDVVDPEVTAERAKAISDVSQIRDMLSSLGYKPDHESVDAARVSLSQIESKLSEELDEIFMQSCPEGTEPDNWRSLQEEKEQLARKAAEREKLPFKAVVRVYEMHEEYENLLKEAEHRLSTLSVSKPVNCQISRNSEDLDDEVDEEVVRILQKSNQTDLDTVDLKGRMLRVIPEAVGRLSTLKVLDLSGNRLETLPDSIAGLTSLEKLFLSANVLVSLPDSIGLLIHLQILNVSANRLKALPDSLSQCRALLELDASFNELTFLPTRLGFELISLEKLDVHLNKLSYLPSSICEMRSLRVLDAHVNELRSLPLAIGKLQNLDILNVSSNFSDLTSIPESICDLTKLVEIDLSNNQIKELPLRFGRLTNLKKINLDQNPLVIPPQDVIARGSESIKDYMAKRYLDYLLEEEQKSTMEIDETETDQSWVQRGSQTMGKWFSVVTGSLSEYLGTNKKSSDDDFLNQQY